MCSDVYCGRFLTETQLNPIQDKMMAYPKILPLLPFAENVGQTFTADCSVFCYKIRCSRWAGATDMALASLLPHDTQSSLQRGRENILGK